MILAIGSYKALSEYDWHQSILVTDETRDVFSRHVDEPKKEKTLKSKIPVLQEVTNNIS